MTPTVVVYRGFRIHTRKKAGLPLYYAIVYSVGGDMPGFAVDRDDEPIESRERAIGFAKYEIDKVLGKGD